MAIFSPDSHSTDAECLLFTIIDNFQSSVAVNDENHKLVFCNDEFADDNKKLGGIIKPGVPMLDIIESRIEQGILPSRDETAEAWFLSRLKNSSELNRQFEITTSDGRTLKSMERKIGKYLLAVYTDISELREAESALAAEHLMLRSVVDSIREVIYVKDKDSRFIMANQAICDHLGASCPDELIGKTDSDYFSADYADAARNEELQVLESGVPIIELERKSAFSQKNENKWLSITKMPFRNLDNEIIGIVGQTKDITERYTLTAELSYRATHDELTGLCNRGEFERLLRHEVSEVRRRRSHSTLCYLDLDQFKIVNDSVGHAAGDELLRIVSTNLVSKVRSSDLIARVGGDEFALVLRDCGNDDAVAIANSILTSIAGTGFCWDEKLFDISASIGLVPIDENVADTTELCSRADIACYAAKEQGRNRIVVYSSNDKDSIARHQELIRIADFKCALEEDRFELHLQPIAEILEVGCAVTHCEVLLRMIDPDGNLVPPGAFIPAAERFGLMTSIDKWVIEHSLRLLSSLFDENAPNLSINLSGNSMTDPTIGAHIEQQIKRYGVKPANICFEITESAFISNITAARVLTEKLRELGCKLALDDFGSGVSSFGYLKSFQADYLKIDGRLVRDMLNDPRDRAMVTAINQVGAAFGMQSIAEFVEDQATIDELRQLGVSHVQGYAIARPCPFEEFAENWASNTKSSSTTQILADAVHPVSGSECDSAVA